MLYNIVSHQKNWPQIGPFYLYLFLIYTRRLQNFRPCINSTDYKITYLCSLRANITPDAFETSTPSLYALRFFSSSTASETVRSRLSRNRISQQSNDSHKEKTDIQLSPVELTINKKIKFPHDKVYFR